MIDILIALGAGFFAGALFGSIITLLAIAAGRNKDGNTMNDLISRQSAIRWVKTECNPYGNPTLDFETGKRVIEHLENMPSK